MRSVAQGSSPRAASSARCSQWPLRYVQVRPVPLCSLAPHAAPQTAAASSGPLSPPAPCCLAVVRGSCWLAVGLWEVRSSARCSQWPPRYERRLCSLALHAAPQTAAASSGPLVPICVRLRCCCAWLWLVGGPLRGAFVCSVLAVALQVRAAPLCPLAVCKAPETAAASSGPFVPICVLWWWSCCCAASRCRPISILGKQQAKVIRRCRPNQSLCRDAARGGRACTCEAAVQFGL